MNRLTRLYWIVRAVGWENVPRRAWHIARGRLGLDGSDRLRAEIRERGLTAEFVDGYQANDAIAHWQRRAERFFTGPRQAGGIRPALSQVADDALWQRRVADLVTALPQGRMLLFHHHLADVGWPVDFNRDPLHDVSWPTGQGRRSYRQFDPRYDDLKCVWEASRFQVAFLLGRDAVRKPTSPAGELFWQVLQQWDEQNPFAETANWVCGQEATFRLMSWLFAACALTDAPVAQANRYHRLSELACLTGRLIEENIVYARSQKNNHAISEATGLWTLGLLFPELKRAASWRAWGRRVICEEVERQIYEDGSYVQHSTNYHRVMLDDLLWAMCLGKLHDDPLAEIHPQVERALDWLLAMIDPVTGRVPNYGANDGALVLPLSCCDYVDFRPVAQAAHVMLRGTRAFPAGPWDEQALWLCGPDALEARLTDTAARKTRAGGWPADFTAASGGYLTTGGDRSWLMTRIHTYGDRPVQADMLHVDLWYGGENVLRDGGSYHYYAPRPWQHFFESTAGHNTVEVDGQDQMERGPSFLWFRWTETKLLRYATDAEGRAAIIAGEHYGYRRLPGRVVHRRTILRLLDSYVILDDLLGAGTHELALRWRLAPTEWQEQDGIWQADIAGERLSLRVIAPTGFGGELACGQENANAEGWESHYYADKQPVPTVVTRGKCALPARLVTVVGPENTSLRVSEIGAADGKQPLKIAAQIDQALAAEIARLSAGAIVCE